MARSGPSRLLHWQEAAQNHDLCNIRGAVLSCWRVHLHHKTHVVVWSGHLATSVDAPLASEKQR
jgi:hypothetical protein